MRITTLVLVTGLAAGSAFAQDAPPEPPAPPPASGLDAPPPPQFDGPPPARAPWMEEGPGGPGERPHFQRRGRRGVPEGRFTPRAGDRPPIDRAEVIKEFDADGDGVLNEPERQAAHETMRQRMHAQMFDRFDTNGDGQLSREEWQAAHREARSFGPPDARRGRPGGDRFRGEMLERFDANGDGQLNDTERQAARGAFEQRREQMRARMLERFDTNGDGVLSETERQAARDAGDARREQMHQRVLEEFDADGDGQLTGDERRAAGEAMRARFRQLRRLGVVDTNHDRSIDKDELAAGLALVTKGDPRADFNGDGEVTPEDAAELVKLVEKMPK